MEREKLSFQEAFANLFFLMLSADNVADIKELKLGKKIIIFEKLDYTAVMNRVDDLSRMPKDEIFVQAIDLLKSLSKEAQLKCLAYMRLIAVSDGSYDERERQLLETISKSEISISIQDIVEVEGQLRDDISGFDFS